MNHPSNAGEAEHFFRTVQKKESFRSLSGFVRRYIKQWVYAVEMAIVAAYGDEYLAFLYENGVTPRKIKQKGGTKPCQQSKRSRKRQSPTSSDSSSSSPSSSSRSSS